MKKINDLFKKRIVILDGATGTELQRQGMARGACPEGWVLKNPQVMSRIHSAYQKAGSDVIYACTFGANRIKLKQYGLKDVYNINKKLVHLAKRAVTKESIIAGDIGPTGKFVEPFGSLGFEEAVSVFKEQIKGLLAGGVDIFVIETMMDIQEARAALIAVKEISDEFTIVTMTFDKDGRTLNGTDALTALATLQSLGADAFGCNCSTGPEDMLNIIDNIKPYAKVPLVAKPNAGVPTFIRGKTLFSMDEKTFAKFAKELTLRGVNLIGGCCGTTPDYIRELKGKLTKVKPILPLRKSLSILTSSRKHLLIEKNNPLVVIGESINPTGKKKLSDELRKGKTSLVRELARKQESQGADLLDINVGASGVDQVKTLKRIITLLAPAVGSPLVIDSSNPEAVEAALRIYPGRALINSISGEKKKLKKLLKIAAKYGAMFIILPLDQRGIPKTLKSKTEIIQGISREAAKYNISKDDVIIDGMVMTVSSKPSAALDTLELISWVKNSFKGNSVIGLSNVSFGLPLRSGVNAAYLAMAQSKGLSVVIANPLDEEVMNIKRAADLLLQKDKSAKEFLACFGNISSKDKEPGVVSKKQKVFDAIIDGNKEDIIKLVDEAIKAKEKPDDLIQKVMIPAINQVGDSFDKKEYFLPQLIASAEAMKKAFEHLKGRLKGDKIKGSKKTAVILATVKGDIHDIGKNIVSLILQNHGFAVVDLGKDISAKKIIQEIKRHKAPIVGLSALMTTTMVNMKEVIDMAKSQKLNCRFVVGGAVVNPNYARFIGAAYAKDGVDAVRVAKRLSGSK